MNWQIPRLAPGEDFPPASMALPALSPFPGLLAAGGRLDADTLERAYRHGIFPWFSPGEPILWWSTDPRMVLRPEQLRVTRSLKKSARRFSRSADWHVRIDTAFARVMQQCGAQRAQTGTWITPEMLQAYSALHVRGLAHSFELWEGDALRAGLYGVCIGRMFYGESMFTEVSDGSKTLLMALCGFCLRQGIALIDCQQQTDHLAQMGAAPIPRADFLQQVSKATRQSPVTNWQYDDSTFFTDCARWL
ncbi:MAG: leucyl/phenylalanyl-tRNA--protein transferase [Thiomonas sp.]|uniref:leucyl/phenylalanyl-tRNA--protein transferase n=1 Tax=Thiomonas sp. TaxID=2047785 RepID=UPI002A35E508|nr:leucyl/phenylalanyl-tRNA--protein transferase [Thiomonas sp.]MDY0330068.1 leucyl/phenylalanyl-tRNA--protein transferase [Thiomonas sp.]